MIEATEGSRTLVSSLEGWGNSRYTTVAIYGVAFRRREAKVTVV